MAIISFLKRLLPGQHSTDTDPTAEVQAAWTAMEARTTELDDTYEHAMELLDQYNDDPSPEREGEIAQAFRELRDGWAEIAREAGDAMESERDLQRDVQTLREMKQGHEHWIREYDDELQRIRKSAQESKRVYDEWAREFERDPSHFMEAYYISDPATLVTESLEDDD